jgi:hypothetical protein
MTNSSENTIERSLLDSLHAYVKDIEIPNTREDLLAITSSILTFQQKQVIEKISPDLIEPLIQNVVAQFNPDTLINSVVNLATEELVQEVNQWRQSLENQVLDSLNAFAQKFKPEGITNLLDTIVSIIPLVEDALLGKFQVNSLIQQVIKEFDFQTALEQVIGEDALAIAQKLADFLQFGNLEQELLKAVLDGKPLLNQTLENVTESLINSELHKIIGNDSVQFDIDLMVRQVTLKINIMQASLPPSKSAKEIANQVDDEVKRFLEERPKNSGIVNLFQGRNFPD